MNLLGSSVLLTVRKQLSRAALLGVLACSPFLGASAAQAAVESYSIDGSHTAVVFKINHLGFSNTYGRFNTVEGSFTLDRDAVEKSAVTVKIKSESIDTNDAKRDKHLRSPDFFNVKLHPEISFTSTAIKKLSDTEFEVAGNLLLNGVTKPVTLKLTKNGEGSDPGGNHRVGFDTSLVIKRSDYGMNYMAGAIGDDVTLMISTEGVRK